MADRIKKAVPPPKTKRAVSPSYTKPTPGYLRPTAATSRQSITPPPQASRIRSSRVPEPVPHPNAPPAPPPKRIPKPDGERRDSHASLVESVTSEDRRASRAEETPEQLAKRYCIERNRYIDKYNALKEEHDSLQRRFQGAPEQQQELEDGLREQYDELAELRATDNAANQAEFRKLQGQYERTLKENDELKATHGVFEKVIESNNATILAKKQIIKDTDAAKVEAEQRLLNLNDDFRAKTSSYESRIVKLECEAADAAATKDKFEARLGVANDQFNAAKKDLELSERQRHELAREIETKKSGDRSNAERVGVLEKQLADAHKALKDKNERLDELETRLTNDEQQNKRLTALQQEQTANQKAIDEKNTLVENLKAVIMAKDTRIDTLATDDGEVKLLREQVAHAQDEAAKSTESLKKIEDRTAIRINELKDAVASKNTEIENLKAQAAQLPSLNAKVNDQQTKIATLETELATHIHASPALSKDRHDSGSSDALVANLEEQIQCYIAQLSETSTIITSLEAQNTHYDTSLTSLLTQTSALKNDLKDSKMALANSESRVNELTLEFSALHSNIGKVEKLEADLTNANEHIDFLEAQVQTNFSITTHNRIHITIKLHQDDQKGFKLVRWIQHGLNKNVALEMEGPDDVQERLRCDMAEAEAEFEEMLAGYEGLKKEAEDSRTLLKEETDRFEQEIEACETRVRQAKGRHGVLSERVKDVHKSVERNGPVQLLQDSTVELVQSPINITIKLNVSDEPAKTHLQHLWSYFPARSQLFFEGPEDVVAVLKERIGKAEKEHATLRAESVKLNERVKKLQSTLICNEAGFTKEKAMLKDEVLAWREKNGMNAAVIEKLQGRVW